MYFLYNPNPNKEMIISEIRKLKKTKLPESGFIYAMKIGNRIKLGKTANPKNRLKTFKQTSPDAKYIILKPVNDSKTAETELCKYFDRVVTKNEWIDYSEETENKVLDYFKNAS